MNGLSKIKRVARGVDRKSSPAEARTKEHTKKTTPQSYIIPLLDRENGKNRNKGRGKEEKHDCGGGGNEGAQGLITIIRNK